MKMKNQLKVHKAIITSLLLILIISSCSNKIDSKNNVAMVGSNYISKDLYSKELNFYSHYYSKKYGNNYLNEKDKKGNSNFDNLKEDLLDSLIKDEIMLIDLKNNKIKVDNNDAEKLYNQLAQQIYGRDSLNVNLKAIDSDETTFNDILYRDSIRKAHYEMFLKNANIKDQEVYDFYKENKDMQRQYKYNALIFDNDLEAEKVLDKIKSNQDFKKYLNAKIKNYDVKTSDFVYEDDPMLKKSGMKDKDTVSDMFEFDGKKVILMINSYNENENELLLAAKEKYMKESYDKYLKDLIKKSKIRVFI